ncbi:chondroitin sulfate proteoglycan 4 [Aplochiton taeniatus]
MPAWRLFLFALTALLALPSPAHGVSYFGDSFCRIQSIQDVSSFHLTLQFKTSRRSGLLLLAAGMKDYMFLELQNGKLQVSNNRGLTGEILLSSPEGVPLNNLLEHKVSVTLQDSRLTMVIDDLFTTFVPVWEGEEELNIDLGVWLGGTGDLETSYLNNAIPPFRGCMTNVKLESHQFDILETHPPECQDTKESCSGEFGAGDGEATSFISPEAFVSFPTWSGASGGPRTLEFLMKTTIEDALLVFHPGRGTDFVAVGVMGGYLKGVLDPGNGLVLLDNPHIQLDDDQWHRIKVQVDQEQLELSVDSQAATLPLRGAETLDLVGNLYLGGIQGKMKDVFRDSGFLDRMEEELTSENFIGCLGEIKVNQKDRSLQDALVTKDVHVKCEGDDYDYSSYYDSEAATTTPPVTVRYVSVDPQGPHCSPTADTPRAFRNITKLLEISPLLVPEGGEAVLDLNNLHPTFDLHRVGLQQSQIIFTLQSDPWYGLMDMNVNTRRAQKFTLLDVIDKKIKYLHDGNEKHGDQIQLEVVAHSDDYLPECLKTPRQYLLPVEILPVNDIPQLSGGVISITENGRTRLTSNLIGIVDSDTRCEQLLVTVTSAASPDTAYLESSQQPGHSLTEFTCRQLKDGHIYFVHKGGSVGALTLEVTDGHSPSQSTTFQLSVTTPQLSLVTNTGLVLGQGTHSPIGIHQLAVIANPRHGDIVYNLTQPLRYGELHLLSPHSVPKQVSTFTQVDLEQNRLSYVSTNSEEMEDTVAERIQFDIQLGHFTLWNNTFLVRIMPSPVRLSTLVPLEMEGEEEKALRHTELEAEVKGRSPDPASIQFLLLKGPTLGDLLLWGRTLAEGQSFTQQDLKDGHVAYRVQLRGAQEGHDHFLFRVVAEEQSSPVYSYPITIPADSDAPVLTNERMVILRGWEVMVKRDYLWAESSRSSHFVYRVTQDPLHGRLIRGSPPGMPRFEGAIRVFSNEDIQLGRLIYKHDGSHSSEDEFHFLVFEQGADSPSLLTDGPVSLSGVFRISTKSQNQQAPQRLVDRPFEVVRHGQRLLTTEDILFTDADSAVNDSQIVLSREGILSGNIVSTSDPTKPLYRFTQADLRDKKVLFVHHGADRERFQLQVSDGVLKTTALLEVQAGEPYLRLETNAMLVLDQGRTRTLNTSLLSAQSNMDIRDLSDITYQVTTPPSNGRIIVSGVEALSFTQEDLRKGVVSYEHSEDSRRSKDSFGITVQALGQSEEGTFRIKVLKQGDLSQPEVITNQVIIAYEGEHTVINQTHLQVEQADILPTEMVFSIKEPPRLGHVVMVTDASNSTAAPSLDYISLFTQEDIRLGRVLYVSSSQQGRDWFSVDVSNGLTVVPGLQVVVDIVPRLIPIHTLHFTVREGGGVPLTPELLNVTHPFYTAASIDFLVEDPPQHGELRYLDGESQLSFFTWEEVQLGHVYYTHDSSESLQDSFTLSASTYDLQRHSLPTTLTVTVTPVNDEPPRLTLNTGLEVLSGEEADISSSMLSTEDMDTPPEELIYSIDSLANGMVALKEFPEEGVQNFTQAQINNGEVIFLHEGQESGGFSFTVQDGEHTSPLYQFTVTTRPITITMETQEELVVFPGSRQPISSANLGAVTNEDGDEISYLLVRPPRLGRLILSKDRSHFDEIDRFTQTELRSGSVFYEHQMPVDPFWVVRDSMELLVSSPPAPPVHHVLPVTVSFYAAQHNVSSLWRNRGVEMVQGQRQVVDSSVLDASNLLAILPLPQREHTEVVFELKTFPQHGRVTLEGLDLPRATPSFTQKQLNQGQVEYLHDDSGAPSDSFSFRVRLGSQDEAVPPLARSVVLEEVFSVSVRRRDSNPPEPVRMDVLLEVLQGSMTVVTQKHLNTRDPDSPPDEVRYTVTTPPANGRLVHALTMETITEFTQEDVNEGQVGFVSDGLLANGVLEFTVSDGKHSTGPQTLDLLVLARTLVLTQAPEIRVRQGDDETLLTQAMLHASTGGPMEEEVLYEITNSPKYAAVMVDRQPTSAFTQTQIREGRVSVRFIKSTSSRDTVGFVARSRAANVTSALNVTVTPLARIALRPLLPRGALVLLDRRLLDASALANRTRSSPMYSVTQQPQGTRFVRVGGPGEGQPVDTFSQKDLDEGRVALEVLGATRGSPEGLAQDEARLLLKAHGVPPAECVLSFQTGPYNASTLYPATLLRTPYEPQLPASPRGTPPSARWPLSPTPSEEDSSRKPVVSRRNTLWSILIPILLILLLLLLAAILAYYLVRKNKTGKHDVQTAAAAKPKNSLAPSQETFRKTDPNNSIPMSDMQAKDGDPELLQHCRNPGPKKNQYWV